MDKYGIYFSLVVDVYQYFYRRIGVIGVQFEEVIVVVKKVVMDNCFYKCLFCGVFFEFYVFLEWLVFGGKLYNLVKSIYGQLRIDKNYSFFLNNLVCLYDLVKDVLVLDYGLSNLIVCNWCYGIFV